MDLLRQLVQAYQVPCWDGLDDELAADMKLRQSLLSKHPPPDAPGAHLLVISPTTAARWGSVHGDWLIGREPTCQLQLDHPWVSRRHCSLSFDKQDWVLTHLGQSSKTFVNGQAVSEHYLANGDVLGVGPFRLLFKRTFA